jgi:hypothetical protein
MLPGRLHEWDVRDYDNGRGYVERTYLECVISETSNLCLDVVVYDINGTRLGNCRSDARISRGFSRFLWEE